MQPVVWLHAERTMTSWDPTNLSGLGRVEIWAASHISKGPKKIKINKNKSNKGGGEGKWSKEAKEEEEERGNHNNNNHTVSLCAFLEFTSESRSVRIVSRSFPFFFFFFYFDSLPPPHHQPLHLKKRKNNPNAQQKWLYYTQYLYWCVCITVVCVSGLQTTQEKWHVATWIAQVEVYFFFSLFLLNLYMYIVQI